jgi:hypothetical protein
MSKNRPTGAQYKAFGETAKLLNSTHPFAFSPRSVFGMNVAVQSALYLYGLSDEQKQHHNEQQDAATGIMSSLKTSPGIATIIRDNKVVENGGGLVTVSIADKSNK